MADELDPVVQQFEADFGPYIEEMRRAEEESRQYARDNEELTSVLHELVHAVEENSAMVDELAYQMKNAAEESDRLRDHAIETGEALGHLRDEAAGAAVAEHELGTQARETSEKLDLMGLSGLSTASSLGGLVGIIGGLVVVAAGVAPALVAAGAGLGAFAAFALPTLMQVKNGYTAVEKAQAALANAKTAKQHAAALAQEKAAWAALPAPIAMVVLEIQNLKEQWKQAGAQFQIPVVQDLSQGIGILSDLIPKLIPLATAGAGAMHLLLSALGTGVGSAGFSSFLGMLTTLVVPATQAIMHLAGALTHVLGSALTVLAPESVPLINFLADLVKALGGPLVAALSVAVTLLNGLLKAIDPLLPGLSKIATMLVSDVGSGLESLVPILSQVIQILGGTFIQILTDLEPIIANLLTPNSPFMYALGLLPGLLRAILPLLTFLSGLMAHPMFAQIVVDILSFIVAGKAVIALLGLASKAFALLGLSIEATPVGWIITAIAAVVFIFIELWQHCAAFRNFWKGLWQDIKILMQPITDWIHNVIQNMERWWHDHGAKVKEVLTILWTWAKAYIFAYLTFIVGMIKGELQIIEGVFKAIWDSIRIIVETVWKVMSIGIRAYVHIIYDIIGAVMDLIHGHWRSAWLKIKDATSTYLHAIVAIVKTVTSGFVKLLFTAGRDLIVGLWNGINSMVGALLNYLKNLASSILGAFGSILGIHSPSVEFFKHGVMIVTGLIQGLTSGHAPLRNAMQALAGIVGGTGLTAPALAYGGYPPQHPGGGSSGSGGGAPAPLNVYIDGQKLFQIMQGETYRYNVRNSGTVTGVLRPGTL